MQMAKSLFEALFSGRARAFVVADDAVRACPQAVGTRKPQVSLGMSLVSLVSSPRERARERKRKRRRRRRRGEEREREERGAREYVGFNRFLARTRGPGGTALKNNSFYTGV
jgi:hypothetical protein